MPSDRAAEYLRMRAATGQPDYRLASGRSGLLVSWPGGSVIVTAAQASRASSGAAIGTALSAVVSVTGDQYANAVHAVLIHDENGWGVTDCGSTNGTWWRIQPTDPEQRVVCRAPLIKGSKIRVGRTILTVVPID